MEHTSDISVWLESSEGKRIPVTGTCYIGRANTCNVSLPDERVSRRHAMIHTQGEEHLLIDLGSANGTYLNGRRVAQPSRLVDQDQVKIAGFQFVFRQKRVMDSMDLDSSTTDRTVREIRNMQCWLLVADIEGSTQFLQTMSQEEAPRVTGKWLALCKQVVDESRGEINKYLGDGFLAYWIDDEAAAGHVAAALLKFREIRENAVQENPPFRIVVHHGRVVMGGEASLGEESLLGSEVNFVFRLEKVAGMMKVSRMMSEPAAQLLKPHLAINEYGRYPVPSFKGEHLFFTY